MPTPTPRPFIPGQRPPTAWETDQIFRQPEYESGAPWTSHEDQDDED
ncbi:hypothetical protein ACWD4O_38760 [Streptomyces sp. NPDC002623]